MSSNGKRHQDLGSAQCLSADTSICSCHTKPCPGLKMYLHIRITAPWICVNIIRWKLVWTTLCHGGRTLRTFEEANNQD